MEIFLGTVRAFAVGGILCAVAQILIDKTRLTPARILVSYVCAGVVLSALGVYGELLKFAGAGASVPLTGFGHVLAQGVENAVDQYGALGILTGGLTGASAGITSAMLLGLLAAIVAPSRPK
jgi:stage V sporulation protein AE